MDRVKVQVEYQSYKKFVLHQSRNKYAAFDRTARMESIRFLRQTWMDDDKTHNPKFKRLY